ncbi:hypothetical protein [Paenibacillus sp. sgz302251]|uniref:hypothetical protein n=1 Tax=Paenibacillus sp. sgz302251 TaxID=3414493 RepID=UPI003C7AD219
MSFEESKLLLNQAKITLQEIESSYDHYLSLKDVSVELQLKIKDFLDKVNPALDYAAFKIFTTYCAKYVSPEKLNRAESIVYFPYKKNITDFEDYLKKVFPNLVADKPDIVDIFKKYQPFPARSKWLYYLRELVSHNKHRNFTKQSLRQTTNINYLNLPGGNQLIGVTLVTEGNGQPISINGQHVDLENSPHNMGFNGSIETDFIFKDIDQPVLKTLKRIYASAPTVIKDLEQII